MNDCFRTVCPIYFHPKIIAATCIWMAARYMQQMGTLSKPLQEGWTTLIDIELDLSLLVPCKDEMKKLYQ